MVQKKTSRIQTGQSTIKYFHEIDSPEILCFSKNQVSVKKMNGLAKKGFYIKNGLRSRQSSI